MNKWIAEFELEDGDSMPKYMDLNYMGARLDFHCKPVSDCIPIPEDATNGDVIKAMFPDAEIEINHDVVKIRQGKTFKNPMFFVQLPLSWWNAKYKGVE